MYVDFWTRDPTNINKQPEIIVYLCMYVGLCIKLTISKTFLPSYEQDCSSIRRRTSSECVHLPMLVWLFCFCDNDPITLLYEVDLDILKMYLPVKKIKFLDEGYQNLSPNKTNTQTDTETHRCDWTHYHAAFMGPTIRHSIATCILTRPGWAQAIISVKFFKISPFCAHFSSTPANREIKTDD